MALLSDLFEFSSSRQKNISVLTDLGWLTSLISLGTIWLKHQFVAWLFLPLILLTLVYWVGKENSSSKLRKLLYSSTVYFLYLLTFFEVIRLVLIPKII